VAQIGLAKYLGVNVKNVKLHFLRKQHGASKLTRANPMCLNDCLS